MNSSTSATFRVNVTNKAPYFGNKLSDISVSLNSKFEYKMPFIIDEEFNPVKMIWHKPDFVNYNSSSNHLIIHPKLAIYDLGFF
jgi:hypothetical protein